MKKLRDHKKDATRTLKSIKLQQIVGHHQIIDPINTHSKDNNNSRIIYASFNKKQQNSNTAAKRRNLRYERTIQDQNQSRQLYRQGHSLDAKNGNFLKISQNYTQTGNNNKNPYLKRNRVYSMAKRLRQSSQQPRRIITQQSLQFQNPRKNIHFKTIASVQIHKYSNTQSILEQARALGSKGLMRQSEMLLQRVLKQDPENKQALYLSGLNFYKQLNFRKCLLQLNTLFELDERYNKNAYLIASESLSKLGQQSQAMLRVNACIAYYPDYYDAYFHKAQLYIKLQDYENAIKSLKKALKLAKDPFDCCLKLGQCYEKAHLFQLALKLYNNVIAKSQQIQTNNSENNQKQICIYKRAHCEKKLQRYTQYIQSLKLYLSIRNKNNIQNLAAIYYEIGYAYYKLKNYANAIMNLQQVLQQKNKKQSTSAMILLTIIHIRRRDFYEAYHCLLRKQHIQVQEKQLTFYQAFCEGVLSLMKRKFQIGLKKLLQIESVLLQSPKDNQFKLQISTIYPLYLSYAYFCLNKMDKCITLNKKIIQTHNPLLNIYMNGVQFNLVLCEGLEELKHRRLLKAKQFFEKSTRIYPNKPEGFLYLAVTLIYMFLDNYSEELIITIKQVLTLCIQNLKQLNNNYAASAYYIKAAFSAFMGEWQNAIRQIDESIERAQDNQPKSFYLRALILGCCQNFKQAITQVSIAISLNCKQPTYYLLKSRCQQIEGEGNKAFVDLQQYIALCPDDTEVHKYAGHLLFENGAFEDAIQAYQNGQLVFDIQNYDVFLTRAKTYFLLGNFQKCITDMQIAYKLNSNDSSVSFDIEVMQILKQFFYQEKKSNLIVENAQQLKDQLQNLCAVGQQFDYGRIFKKIQLTMLLAMLQFYSGKYKQASKFFKQAQTLKQVGFGNCNQSQIQEEMKQKQFFVSQMHYNRALCYLMMNQNLGALKSLQLCNIQSDSKTHSRLSEFINILKNKKSDKKSLQVFSQKNKMSRLLNEFQISINNDYRVKLRLCIPFPKVEPPQINPKFEMKILKEINIEDIQKKPQAPWIIREQNSIKFTQNMQNFSRLQINNSQLSRPQQEKHRLITEQQQLSQDISNSRMQKQNEQLKDLKAKLKLDDKIQSKLNKLINGTK